MVPNSVSNFLLGQKSHWTNVSLDKSLLGLMSLGKSGPWTTVPWTNVSTPFYLLKINCLFWHEILSFYKKLSFLTKMLVRLWNLATIFQLLRHFLSLAVTFLFFSHLKKHPVYVHIYNNNFLLGKSNTCNMSRPFINHPFVEVNCQSSKEFYSSKGWSLSLTFVLLRVHWRYN